MFVYSVVLKKTRQKKDVQQIFSPVSAETKKLSFFLSDFLLGFGNGRLERLMRFSGSTAAQTIHLTNQNQTTPLFEVSIHQTKKDTTKQTEVTIKNTSKQEKQKILRLKQKNSLFN